MTDAERPGAPRAWIAMAVLALPTLLVSVDASVIYLAVPSIARALHATAVEQLWILDIYSFVLAGFLVPMGALGDRIGYRRLLLLGAASFGLASVLAAFAPTAAELILARAVLGVAGATIAPSTATAPPRTSPRDPSSSSASAPSPWPAVQRTLTAPPQHPRQRFRNPSLLPDPAHRSTATASGRTSLWPAWRRAIWTPTD